MGYRITRYSHIEPERILMSDGPWNIERLFDTFKATLGSDLQMPKML